MLHNPSYWGNTLVRIADRLEARYKGISDHTDLVPEFQDDILHSSLIVRKLNEDERISEELWKKTMPLCSVQRDTAEQPADLLLYESDLEDEQEYERMSFHRLVNELIHSDYFMSVLATDGNLSIQFSSSPQAWYDEYMMEWHGPPRFVNRIDLYVFTSLLREVAANIKAGTESSA